MTDWNKYYHRNPEYYKEKAYKRKKRISEWFQGYKEGLHCTLCGESESVCLDFHHTGDDKGAEIAHKVWSGCSIETLLEEISKCVVVCANCHRKIHAGLMETQKPPVFQGGEGVL